MRVLNLHLALAGLLGTVHANGLTCGAKKVVVEYQPIVAVCSSVTSVTTETRTTTECASMPFTSALTSATSSTGTVNTSSATKMQTASSTTKSCPTPTCDSGIEMAMFKNPFSGDTSPTYASLELDYFKSARPVSTEVVHDIVINDSSKKGLIANAAAIYRGFLFTCQNGTYEFSSPRADDVTFMWFGEKAYSGWNRANADIAQFYSGDNAKKTISRNLVAGVYYPIRVFWGNTQGVAFVQLNIKGPDGRELSISEAGKSNWLVTEACDGSYKPYPPFA